MLLPLPTSAGRPQASLHAPLLPRPSPYITARRRELPRSRRQPKALGASGGSCGGGGAQLPSDRQHELQSLQERIAAHEVQLQAHVQLEQFDLAAAERDALIPLQLRARQLELEAQRQQNGAVLHAIGTVIRHRRYGYRGVIAGHDPRCQADPAWIEQMRVDMLPGGREQPFYSVLVDTRDRPGAQTTYVAQENIICMRKPGEVQHPLIPQLFVGFSPEDGAYIPGPRLRAQYPADF